MAFRSPFIIALLGAVAAIPTAAQPALKASRNLVLINASVVDRNGRFVSELDARQFVVLDRKQPVAIRSFGIEDAPVSTLILLDTSDSMRRGMAHVRAALKRYVDASLPEDDFCLITFAETPGGQCGFTRDTKRILDEASDTEASGSTALLDALIVAMEEVKKGTNHRKVILILSDGIETSSRFTWNEAAQHARESTASIYAVVPKPWKEETIYSVARFEDIVQLTGGRVFPVKGLSDYPEFFTTLDVRRQYIIGFTPREPALDGQYHTVAIRLQGETARSLRVDWRRGYYAPFGGHQ